MKFSRRDFISASLGLGSVLFIPNTLLAKNHKAGDDSAKTETQVQALKEIRAYMKQCTAEGAAFSSDKLAADNNAQWDRLVNHYFERDKYTCLSVNSANLCPSMKPVQYMVDLVQDMLVKDISFPMRGELAEASLGYGLEAMKKWFGLEKQKYEADYLMALVSNSTQGNNFINNGLVVSGFFDPQKHNVVVWDVNHPTNYQAWEYRRATQGWAKDSVRTVRTKMFSNKVGSADGLGVMPSDPANEDELIKAILSQVDKNTRVVTLSWQSNECGMLLPMERLVYELRKVNKDMHIHADSAQTMGVLDLKLGDLDVDSITGSFHKWPCGPKMVGMLYMNNKTGAAERFTPSEWGYDEHIMTPEDYGFRAASGQIDPNAKRFSYLGQQNDATLVSTWMAALFHTGEFHPQVNPKRIEERIHYLGSRAKEELFRHLPSVYPDFNSKKAYKWISTPTTNDKLRSSVFLFRTPDGIKAGDVVKNVYEQHQIAIANLYVLGHDLVRISPTFCNTAKDVEGAVRATVDVIKAMKKGKLANNTVSRFYA
jgi:selenocysteine lyase/cysteine desulfurase